jgi:hypothetical protein
MPMQASKDQANVPAWRRLADWLGWPIALTVAGFLLLGIPGALLMEIAAPIAGLITPKRLPADSAWPMAIIVSLVWPWFLLPGRMIARALVSPDRAWWRGVGMIALVLALTAGVALAVALQAITGRL